MKAKTKFTRLWSVLLVLVMVVGMLPTVALAEGSAPATEKADFSTDPTAALALLNAAKTGTTDSTWDPDTNTLTLNGVNFTTTASTAVKLPADSEIVLNGDNTITSGEARSEDSFGIYAEGSLTIKGAGKLTVTSDTANDDSEGIYAKESIDISGNADVIAISGTANDVCYGIHAKGSIAISGNAKVNATGSKAKDDSYGIYTNGNITITDGTVTANGGTATNDSCGICTKGNITITDGTVTATGGEAGDSYGIYADDDVNIAGGTVNANGGTATNNSFGICTNNGDVNIAGGTVNANGGTATNNSFGIYAHYDVNISGGTLIAKVTSGNGTANALNRAPKTLPDTYWWRTSNSGAYHKHPASAYIWDAAHTYFEIQKPGYTVTFDANGGSGEMAGADVVSGEYTLPANGFTAPEGKRFKAWSVNGTEKAVGDKITVSADTTVKAVWEDIEYTVTVTNGTASVSKAAAGTTVTLNANAAPDGQVFDKWVVESGSITLADASSATTTFTMPAGDVSVKATYHTHSYGSVWKSGADKHWHECSCGDKSAEAVHTAGDWIIDTPATATTDGTKHKACTTCSYVMETGTIPATGYTVSFDANGGTGTMADVTGISGTYTLPENGFTAPEGKQFKAWSVGGNEKDAGATINVTANTTVTAIWENIPVTYYTVTFDSAGGSAVTAQTIEAGQKATKPADPTKDGFDFKGWTLNGSAYDFNTAVNGNITLVATWEQKQVAPTTYTVSFAANGGTGTMADVTGVSGTYTLPENGFTAPEGKQFKSWSVGGNEKAARDKITVTANITVTAVWENIPAAPIEYEILDGANSSWTHDSDGSLSIRGNGAFSEFVGVKVDGKSVDEKYYTVKEGSTIVTLKAGYLNTLTVGSHTLEIIWTDGSASTAFTVNAKAVVDNDTKSPQTGDNSMMALWIAVLFVSGIGVMGTTIYIRKKKYSVK